MHKIRKLATAVAVALIASGSAQATNGYFKLGYGSKARGLAGAGIAMPQDSLAPATNPAGLTRVGNRADLGVEFFSPKRDGSLDATRLGGAAASADSGATLFAIPNAGFSQRLGDDMAWGLSIVANGGMNTRYNSNIYTNALAPSIPGFVAALGPAVDPNVLASLNSNPNTTPALGVNLAQVIVAPTISYELNKAHSVGASLLVGYQRFRAYGLGLFQPLSVDPASVTNRGDDDAWGAGLRIGWSGQLTRALRVGAVASSKIYMEKLDRYRGLFAEGGDFDIPANYGVGLALDLTPKFTVALDVQRILYSGVAAINNPGPTAGEFLGSIASVLTSGAVGANPRPLGSSNGYGFGWDDITVYKLGMNYDYNDQWTFRLGVNYGENPIDSDQNLFNILAPGVVQTHATVGFSYRPTNNGELTVAYMHAFREDQSHTYSTNFPGFGNLSYSADLGMDQDAIEVSWGWTF